MVQWKLSQAKNQLSEVVDRALTEGPQEITRRSDAVVVVARDEWDRIAGRKPNFIEFLLGPKPDFEGVNLERDRSIGRDVELD